MIVKTLTKQRRKNVPEMELYGPVVRVHETWSPGDSAHQGDVIFVCLPKLPGSVKARGNRQLAEGDTRGSKHVLCGGDLYDTDHYELSRMIRDATKGRVNVPAQYIGPVFAGEATVTHPQHQHQAFPADTVTACYYQRNLDADEREIRARD